MKNTYLVKIISKTGVKLYEKSCGTLAECKKYMRTINGECSAMVQKNYNYKGMKGYAEETLYYNIKNNKVLKIIQHVERM